MEVVDKHTVTVYATDTSSKFPPTAQTVMWKELFSCIELSEGSQSNHTTQYNASSPKNR